jgi:hypothetical protein
VRRAGSALEARDLLRTNDPRRVAIVEDPVGWHGGQPGDLPPVEVVSYRPDRVELRTGAAAPSWFVMAESWAPDWRAVVDDRAAELHPTNLAFQGLPLDAGPHRIAVEYVPKETYIAMSISSLAWLGLAGWMIKGRKKES